LSEQVKICMATISRFHSFEAALQLQKRDALAAIYSGLARYFLRRYPVHPDALRTFPWIQTPFEVLQRLRMLSTSQGMKMAWLAKKAIDHHISRTMPHSHIYMALSGIGLKSGKAAQDRGIAHICVRSASHIASQNELLQEEYSMLGLPFIPTEQRMIDREEEEYAQADIVLVPSSFARQSFVEKGIEPARIRDIPFGVPLSSFKRTCDRDPEFCILYVGNLGVRKGIHYLLQAFKKADIPGATLRLIGNQQPETKTLLERFPVDNVELLGPQFQPEVVNQMSRASVLVLPSIEEGFGMVMSEALACGCPVISSESTGGQDLYTDGVEGFIYKATDVDTLAKRFVQLHDDKTLLDSMSANAAKKAQDIGGWDSYGDKLIPLCVALAKERGHDVYGN